MLMLSAMSTAWAGKLMDPIASEPQASGFNLETVDGITTSLDDYAGRFVLLNFWATWCAPCRREMPAMSNLHDQLAGEGLDVVGVHVGPGLAGVKKFLEAVPVNFTILIDKDMSLANWGVRGLPTTFLVSPDGRLLYQAIGERHWDSPGMVGFLTEIITGHGRMAADGSSSARQGKSFLDVFVESIGWNRDRKNFANQLFSD